MPFKSGLKENIKLDANCDQIYNTHDYDKCKRDEILNELEKVTESPKIARLEAL